MRLVVVSALATALVGLPGCKASVNASVNTGAKVEVADFDKPLDASSAAESSKAFIDDTRKEAPLLGARQDLTFKGTPSATCQCLAVAAGPATDASFRWSGERPQLDRDGQIAIALTSVGIECPGAGPKATFASYWGYEVVGNDVVVVVENGSPGRPAPGGAIIPRPMGGQVYVRPASKQVPYGRPLTGGGERCQVGTLAASSAPAKATGTPDFAKGLRIRTEEPDPTSSRSSMP